MALFPWFLSCSQPVILATNEGTFIIFIVGILGIEVPQKDKRSRLVRPQYNRSSRKEVLSPRA